ncbi:MAG TPA: peptidoglycan DD-metalloendopeptidase family protein [Alphaproteobacteria bacterium]|nr:peptidoglycan DD-metalloendopeptidase family protein [Alphaproteobacteria bacterium]
MGRRTDRGAVGAGVERAPRPHAGVTARLRASRAVTLLLAVSVLPLAGLTSGGAPAVAAPVASAGDYPSWKDVANAQKDERRARQAVQQIRNLLARLEADVERTQKIAIEKGEIYAKHQEAYDAQAVITQKLQDQADEAAEKAEESKRKAAAMLAQLSKTGGGDLTASLLASGQSGDADALLYRLGAMDQFTQRSEDVYTQAVHEQNNAEALTAQANAAQRILEELKAEAQAAFEEAQAAALEAQEKLEEQEENKARLEAQLAVLVEKRKATQADYLKGVREKWGPNAGGIISEQGFARPTSGYITSHYGYRYHPISGAWVMHNGTDIAGQGCGAPIYAAHGGTVSYAGPNGGLGNYVQIEGAGGVSTGYGHIMPGGIHVRIGQHVDPGQPIARVGTTGYSTGCHLHFIVRVNGVLTNPVPFMRARGISIG